VLKASELTSISYNALWQQSEPFNVLDEWDLTNAIAAQEVGYHSAPPATLTYTIVQYGDSAGAEAIWRERRDLAVFTDVRGEEIEVLSLEQLPSLHADHVSLRCEHYSSPSALLQYVDKECVTRLQYGVLYVQFRTRISNSNFSP
jgi:hypothetical protein